MISQYPDQTTSLSFLSTTEKLFAGAWRFLTYFGRDSLIFLLLAQPILSDIAIEAILAASLERINGTTGAVCHEETIGDYATYQHLQENVTSTAPTCSYIMIDSDYYLPVAFQNYYSISPEGARNLLNRTATTAFGNAGSTYGSLLNLNAERIVTNAMPFSAAGNQTQDNLQHLLPDQQVGQWRDSTYGIGGGRIPMDVNTGLVPAALYAISNLSAQGLLDNQYKDHTADMAATWEDNTLHFFSVNETASDAQALVSAYTSSSNFSGPSGVENISDTISYYAIALDGNNGQDVVRIMNTDVCFRLFLLNGTNDEQLTAFLNSTADNIQATFPIGLSTDTGLLISNPAYGDDPIYAANFTTSEYHGTVIWSWPMAMMAKGLEQQLARCTNTGSHPMFCENTNVYENVKNAYNHLWDLIEANTEHLTTELWSWEYSEGRFNFVDFSLLSPTGKFVLKSSGGS